MMNNMLKEVAAGYNLESQADENIYHNTLELLKLYSKVLWRIKSSLREMDETCKELTNRRLTDLIDTLVEIDPRIKEERLNARLHSIENSKSILDFIDLSMLQLKEYPEKGERYYNILKRIYIDKVDFPIENLADEYGVSRSTSFREKKKAINMFGVILWGFIFSEIKVK